VIAATVEVRRIPVRQQAKRAPNGASQGSGSKEDAESAVGSRSPLGAGPHMRLPPPPRQNSPLDSEPGLPWPGPVLCGDLFPRGEHSPRSAGFPTAGLSDDRLRTHRV
jgi:hypothetical protein